MTKRLALAEFTCLPLLALGLPEGLLQVARGFHTRHNTMVLVLGVFRIFYPPLWRGKVWQRAEGGASGTICDVDLERYTASDYRETGSR